MKSSRPFTSLLLVGLPGTASGQTKEGSKGIEADSADLKLEAVRRLDQAMQKEIDEKQVSGVIALIGRKGRVEYYKAFGPRRIEQEVAMSSRCRRTRSSGSTR